MSSAILSWTSLKGPSRGAPRGCPQVVACAASPTICPAHSFSEIGRPSTRCPQVEPNRGNASARRSPDLVCTADLTCPGGVVSSRGRHGAAQKSSHEHLWFAHDQERSTRRSKPWC